MLGDRLVIKSIQTHYPEIQTKTRSNEVETMPKASISSKPNQSKQNQKICGNFRPWVRGKEQKQNGKKKNKKKLDLL